MCLRLVVVIPVRFGLTRQGRQEFVLIDLIRLDMHVLTKNW